MFESRRDGMFVEISRIKVYELCRSDMSQNLNSILFCLAFKIFFYLEPKLF